MTEKSQFFLGRNQKVFGPLPAEEIEALRQSGQLSSYTWIFREGDAQWTPIDPPPALPVTTTRAPLRAIPEPVETRSQRVDQEAFRVILFDHRNAMSGWLTAASDGGCEIHSDQTGSDPLFVQKETACLTLHDTRSGESIKLIVRVSEIGRAGRGWSYQLRWKALPELLNRSIAA